MEFENILVVLCCLTLGVVLGNLSADQATLSDCATKGNAMMLGGGAIICEVKKGQP